MKFYILLILCLIQGLTEFLPISSSGHLLLAEKLFNITDNITLINLFLHLATLLAVVIVYRKPIKNLLKNPFQSLTLKLIISTIITIIFASVYEIFNLSIYLDKYFGFYFLITAVVLMITHFFQKKSVLIKIGEIDYKSSALVGVAQGFAILPGISRSGSTISTLILSGNNETQSAEYSFLLSIPIIIGGFVFEILKVKDWSSILYQVNIWQILIAFLITLFTAIFSIKFTIRFLKRQKFIFFSIYLIVIGIISIILL